MAAGAEPFCLFLFFLSPNGTIVEGAKTTEEHAGNVTCLFLSDNQKYIISGAKDTLLNLWTVETDRKTVNRSTTVRTNLGPISFGIMDRLKTHLILGHDSTFTNVLANISIWKFDQQTGKLTKLAQNVPGEAH